MAWKEWAVPVAVAIVGAGLAVLLAPAPPVEDPDVVPYTFVFLEGPACAMWRIAPCSDVLIVKTGHTSRAEIQQHAQAAGQDVALEHIHLPSAAQLDQVGRSVAPALRTAAPLIGWQCPECPALVGPLIMRGSDVTTLVRPNSTVHATIYVFLGDGLLLASNAPSDQQGRFEHSGFYTPIGTAPWYLGDGRPPQGAVTVPPEVPAGVKAAAIGVPVGGIATVIVEDHPYIDLLGPLYATMRIDAVA